jgi:hypothetical protein
MEHQEKDKKKWIPKKGYTKKCPVDGTEFTGRKNQVYCSPECKIKTASDILSRKNQSFGTLFRSYIRNAELLEKNYPGNNDQAPVSKSLLYKDGFDSLGLIQLKKFQNFEGQWNVIGCYAFRQDPKDPKNIIIIKP